MAEKKRYHDRRKEEMRDAGMLHENHSEVANMPQEVKYHAWPKPKYGLMDSELDDTIAGINHQMDRDEEQGRKGMKPHKY